MAYYQSNYGSYGGGPPPPPGGGAYYGGGGGYGGYGGGGYGGYGGGGYGGYQMGSAPPPGGQHGYGGGAYGGVPGFTMPAVQNCASSYYSAGMQAPPPMQMPPSMQGGMDMHAFNQSLQQNMREHIIQAEMAREKQKRKEERRRRRKKKREEEDEDEEEEEEEEEEEVEVEKPSEDVVKQKLKQLYTDELMRRQAASGTFEVTSGTVRYYAKYDESDPVVQFIIKKWYDGDEGKKDKIVGKDWDREMDCEYLRDALKGLGTNDDAVVHVVTTRCNQQRLLIKEHYKTCYGRDLEEDFKGDLSFNYKRTVLALFKPPAEYDALSIKDAIYGLGTDERALIEILLTRTNAQIREMRKVYNDAVNPDCKKGSNLIEQDIEDDTSGDFKRLLIAACQGNRKELTRQQIEDAVEENPQSGMYELNTEKLCDMDRVEADAKVLEKAGEKRIGTDEEAFIRIFSTQNHAFLKEVYKHYVKLTQRDIRNSIERETSGNFERGLKAIVENIMNRPRFFAYELQRAMKGLGTDDRSLIRLIVSRCEIDMEQIKKEFLELTKQTLYLWLKNDCSGEYRKILMGLVKEN